MTPTFCPRCRAAGIIAVVAGPTCTHHQFQSGPAWFPFWYEAQPAVPSDWAILSSRRMAFIADRSSPEAIASALAFIPPAPVQEFDFA